MKIIKLCLLFFLSGFLFSCQNSKQNTTTEETKENTTTEETKENTTTEETKEIGEVQESNNTKHTPISMDSTKSYGYIQDIFEEHGKTLISVDFVQMIETQTGGGYEIINQNPKLRTFILNSSSRILTHGRENTDIERIKRIVKSQKKLNTEREDEDDLYYQRFEITVKDGFVLEIVIDMGG